jgi:flagellar basal body-associated protein FliL
MKRFERVSRLVFIFVLIYAVVFAVAAFGAPSQSENSTISATASDLTAQLSEAAASEKGGPNIIGIICWVVIGMGILFIIYVLFSSNRRKTGVQPKQVKYRRSPYNKKHRRMQEEYYRYKRNKYK